MMTTQEPAQLLQDVTEEAARLLGSSGAVDPAPRPGVGRDRLGPQREPRLRVLRREPVDHHVVVDGGPSPAIRGPRVTDAADYAADERFPDGALHAEFLERAGIRSRSPSRR